MKLFLICSKHFYNHLSQIIPILEEKGHSLIMPNHYMSPETEEAYRVLGETEHADWKMKMFKESESKLRDCDAVLVINNEKNGIGNYIGGATFLEMYDAFRFGKKIYILNEIPEGMLKDEISGFSPIVLHGKLEEFPFEKQNTFS